MKRIFITGIAGFIGMHLALALKRRGDWVIGCDNFNTYYNVALKRRRSQLLEQSGICVTHCDIVEQDKIHTTLSSEAITHFVHLAAQAGVRHALSDPHSYAHSNLHGFLHILETLKSFPHIPLTYASSSSVYGRNIKIPFTESDVTDNPASFYGATKKSNELMAQAYHYLYGIRSTALRYFTVYGPWGRPDMAYYSFAKAMIENRPITVYADGKYLRDFTYIDDIIRGTIAAIDLNAETEVFNLGNHRPCSVLDLIHCLEHLLERKALIDFTPSPPGDVPVTYADITKSQKMLGFYPSTSLEEGLKKFIDWFLCDEKSL